MRRTMLSLALVAFAVGSSGMAARADTTICHLRFELKGWSQHFDQSAGPGTIVCDNGQRANVYVAAHSPRLRVGTGAVVAGRGTFSAVLDISALLGSYALPAAARVGGGRPAGVAGALSNGQATLAFPLTGPSSKLPATFGRISILAR